MKIDHIGIAVRSIEQALAPYENALGIRATGYEEVEDQGVKVAMLPLGESRLELIEPRGDGSPIEKFLARRGPGIHHIAVRVDDIEACLARFKAAGLRLIDETPRKGADNTQVAFVHPSAMNGVLLELVEHGE
jgi:methylmalonyl-CoA/ethylmalonyl-CoA epimerase